MSEKIGQRNIWQWLPLLVILGLYIATATSYSFAVPVWETPDEPAHFAYIHHIRTQGGPPVQSFEQGKNEVETGHHPPFYYYLGAIVTLPFDISDFSWIKTNPYFSFSNVDGGVNRFDHEGETQLYPNTVIAVHFVRLLSVLFGSGTLICIYLAALLIFGGKSWQWAQNGVLPALLATVLVALLPQFAFISGAVNNDNAVIFFCTLITLMGLKLILPPPTPQSTFFKPDKKILLFFAGLGLAVGLGLLSKYNTAAFIPLVGLALLIGARRRGSWAFFWWGSIVSGAACIAVAGWWFVRAQFLYGDPLGWEMWRSSFRSVDQSANFQLTGEFLGHVWERWFNSFWGYFGWFNLPLDGEIYKWFGRLCLLGVVSFVGLSLLALFGRSIRLRGADFSTDGQFWLGMLFLGLTVVVTVTVAFNYAATFGDAGTQGRYLFTALPAFGIIFSAAFVWMVGWLRVLKNKWLTLGAGWAVVAMVTGVFGILNLHSQNDIIRPAYLSLAQLQSQAIVSQLPPEAVKLEGYFLPAMKLEGYSLLPTKRDEIQARKIKVRLYWRAMKRADENWVGFVHLLDGGQTIAKSDGAPLQGRFPVYKWRQGDLIMDERTFELKDWQVRQMKQYNAPLQLYLGWIRVSDGKRATLEQGGDAITLDWK
jgi:4-amino-4-deoxy-L-arabinose transferase-like glycosyltransferase